VWCHPAHHVPLESYSKYFPLLKVAGLINDYEAGAAFIPVPGLHCRPLPVSHDGGETFGFRLEGGGDLFGNATAIGYVADLGTWDDRLADSLADVDVLALEFNHDVEMECRSGRSAMLIARVLGDTGHLSNDQAAALLTEILNRSSSRPLRHLVQLHLSRDCNRPALAVEAARAVLSRLGVAVELHTAEQHRAGVPIQLGAAHVRRSTRQTSTRNRRRTLKSDACLPGFAEPVEVGMPH
jgi:phosphoribosyl 1,2-cyclic phosphodiesterase